MVYLQIWMDILVLPDDWAPNLSCGTLGYN